MIKKFWDWGWSIYHKNEEVWNYLIVGGLTTVISFIFFWIPNDIFSLNYFVSESISWVFAVAFAYVTNRVFVFKSKEKNINFEMAKFVGSRLITYFLGILVLFILIDLLNLTDLISKLLQQIIILISNYIVSKLIVFRKK